MNEGSVVRRSRGCGQGRPAMAAALLGAALLCAPGAQAGEWAFAPFLAVAGDYDDNAGLQSRTDEEEEISGFIGEIGTGIVYRSDLYEFDVTPRLLSRRYPGDSDFDSDDQYIDFGLDRKTQSGRWGIGGRFIHDYIRTGERANVDFEAEDPEDLEDDDSGRVGARDRRIRWNLMPRWQSRLSETSLASARLRYVNTDYDRTESERLVDYQYLSGDARYSRTLSPRTSALFELNGLWYDADDLDSARTAFGFQGGFRRDVTETTSFEVLGGISTSERTSGGNETNWIGEANFVRRLETIRLLAQYRRAISGTGSGTLTRRDQVNLAFTRRLTDLLTAGLGLLAYTTNSVEDVDFDERDYVQLRSQFTWTLTRVLDLEATYRWTLIDREDENESANSNAITVWLRYRPNPISFAR